MFINEIYSLGEKLMRRRRVLSAIFCASALIALITTTPFSITPSSLIFTILCIAITTLGFIVRAATLGYTRGQRQENTNTQDISMAGTLRTTGMYSVVRHPLFLGDILIRIGLIIYVGVWWFTAVATIVLLVCYGIIILAKEMAQEERFSEEYLQWCRRTNALIPNFRHWVSPNCHFTLSHAFSRDTSYMLSALILFGITNIIRYRVILLSWDVPIFWGSITLIATIVVLIIFFKRYRVN